MRTQVIVGVFSVHSSVLGPGNDYVDKTPKLVAPFTYTMKASGFGGRWGETCQ